MLGIIHVFLKKDGWEPRGPPKKKKVGNTFACNKDPLLYFKVFHIPTSTFKIFFFC
jgi:hypothetical protein